MSFVGRGGGIRGPEVCQTPKKVAAPPVTRGTRYSSRTLSRLNGQTTKFMAIPRMCLCGSPCSSGQRACAGDSTS